MRDGLRLALTTLTVARVRGPEVVDRQTAGRAMTLAPLVGLGVGAVAALVLEAGRALTGTDLLPAALAVAALAVLTRGLHLDGLADTADGLASYRDPAAARAVMKDPGTGALGVVVLVLVLVVQVAALAACAAAGRGSLALVLAAVLGRVAVVAALTPATPAAAPDGLGALVAGTVRQGVPITWAVGVALAGVAVAVAGGSSPDGLVATGQVVAAVVLGLLASRALRRHCVRRLGGLTGDVLGALLEVTTTVSLVVMALELSV